MIAKAAPQPASGTPRVAASVTSSARRARKVRTMEALTWTGSIPAPSVHASAGTKVGIGPAMAMTSRAAPSQAPVAARMGARARTR